ncbi:MAG: hypothetical protein Q9185_003201 [Variospora sp. 1 TL-2023]
MLWAKSRMRSLLKTLHTPPWPPSTAIAPALDKCQPIEEERTPYYDPKRFYPAYLGKILNDRYQVATKVGYGTNSTVWLARDLHQLRWSADRYVAVKINAVNRAGKKAAETELRNMQLISKSNPRHEGRHFVRTLLDSFTLSGTDNEHICLVFEPLREPIWLMNERFKGKVIPSGILKVMIQMLLHGLDYLHTECHIVHTDITALLGPPPQDFLALGKRTSMFYDPEGKLVGTDLTPQTFTLESSVSKIDGQDKRMFLAFVSRMLTWKPEDRSTAKELLSDPWLRADFPGKNQ